MCYMRKPFVLCLTLLLCIVGARAASIVASAEQYNGFTDAAGTFLAAGNQVRIGTFSISDAIIKAGADSGQSGYQTLNQNFTLFGTAHIGDTFGAASPGYFESSTIANSTDVLANAQVYLWVFKTSNNLDPAVNFSNVIETGVYWLDKSSGGAIASAWRFRPNGEVPNQTNIDIADLTGGDNTPNVGAHIAAGTFGTTNNSGAFGTGVKHFATQTAVPEPTAFVLAVVGGFTLLARRRKLA